jgi:hypothetical protein
MFAFSHMRCQGCVLRQKSLNISSVAQVTKYAGGVKKGFAVVLGILLSTLLQVCVGPR